MNITGQEKSAAVWRVFVTQPNGARDKLVAQYTAEGSARNYASEQRTLSRMRAYVLDTKGGVVAEYLP